MDPDAVLRNHISFIISLNVLHILAHLTYVELAIIYSLQLLFIVYSSFIKLKSNETLANFSLIFALPSLPSPRCVGGRVR